MVVTGTAYWASLQAPNTRFEPVYCIDLEVSDADAEALAKEGLTVKTTDEGKKMVKIKRNQFRDNGDENPKPNVVDSDNMPFDRLIGNGSKVNVQYRMYDWEWGGRSGKAADLVGVQVISHVAYGGSEFEPVAEDKEKQSEQTNDNYEGDSPFDDE